MHGFPLPFALCGERRDAKASSAAESEGRKSEELEADKIDLIIANKGDMRLGSDIVESSLAFRYEGRKCFGSSFS